MESLLLPEQPGLGHQRACLVEQIGFVLVFVFLIFIYIISIPDMGLEHHPKIKSWFSTKRASQVPPEQTVLAGLPPQTHVNHLGKQVWYSKCQWGAWFPSRLLRDLGHSCRPWPGRAALLPCETVGRNPEQAASLHTPAPRSDLPDGREG